QAFLLFRNNLEPYRVIVWNFLEMQKILILGSKVGYVPKFPDTIDPMYVRFKLSFESLREDFSYIQKPFTKEQYIKFMEDHYSNRLFVYPLTKLHGKAYDIREEKNNQESLTDVNNITTNNGKTQELHVFNYKKDKIYNILTEDGFYQAGVGRLLIKGNL
ncbi:MAG: hypothetical protein ACFFG0_38430, partial [Candidatus Thorarchaeota archaeon]